MQFGFRFGLQFMYLKQVFDFKFNNTFEMYL